MNSIKINSTKSYAFAPQVPLQRRKEEKNYDAQTLRHDEMKPIYFTGWFDFFSLGRTKEPQKVPTAAPTPSSEDSQFGYNSDINIGNEFNLYMSSYKATKRTEISLKNTATGLNEKLHLWIIHYDSIKDGIVVLTKQGQIAGYVKNLDGKENSVPGEKYLRLCLLKSPMNYKYEGIGTAIIQAAVEESIEKGLGGQLRVRASAWKSIKSPFIFYLKKGFKFENPETNMEDFRARYENIKDENLSFEEYLSKKEEYMFLDREAVEKIWLPKIKANPIFKSQAAETISK